MLFDEQMQWRHDDTFGLKWTAVQELMLISAEHQAEREDIILDVCVSERWQ